ncbi:hypothetical protein Zmor_003643 [Zophobas morio]|uniref:Retrotransposon gag domain-containing protein n=1 Tax=Zophobas morio TaxID=2755281 RepID=A0AA38HLV1_9CUCU|nr:hypothetical protein Zmor_003643 [Zophobas morio]
MNRARVQKRENCEIENGTSQNNNNPQLFVRVERVRPAVFSAHLETARNSSNPADLQLLELQSRFSLISINPPEHNSQTQSVISDFSNRRSAALVIPEFPTALTFPSQPQLQFRTTETIRYSSSSESEIVPIPGAIGTKKNKTLVSLSDKFHDRSTKISEHFQELALTLENLRSTFSIPEDTMPNRSTISGAFASQKTPAVPQFVSPPIFDPCSGDANKFLAQYERCAVANNLKITYCGSFLSGVANRWYEEFVAGNPDSTWDDIVDVFKFEFEMNATHDADFRFESRRQYENESVREYFFKLKLLTHEA